MPVRNGDLLFRYLIPSQFSSNWSYTQKILRKIIELQKKDIQKRELWNPDRYIDHRFAELNAETLCPKLRKQLQDEADFVQANMQLVGHVGIADIDAGEVLEIGKGGYNAVDIGKRAHYDIVVRFPQNGEAIRTMARRVYEKNRSFRYSGWVVPYPEKQLPHIIENPADPNLFTDTNWVVKRHFSDLNARNEHKEDNMNSEVVCSHLTHAILYAVFEQGGTVATATKEEFNRVFRISPSELVRFIRYGLGLFKNAPKADIKGVQHQGMLSFDASRLVDVLQKKEGITKLDYSTYNVWIDQI